MRLDGEDVYNITAYWSQYRAKLYEDGINILRHCMADALQSFSFTLDRFRVGLVSSSLAVLDMRAILGTIGIIVKKA